MNGLRRNESNNIPKKSGEEEQLISLSQAAGILELSEEEVRGFVNEGRIPAYKIGGEYLRFKKSQIEALRGRIRILKHQAVPIYDIRPFGREKTKIRYSLLDRARDFIYFNDFYILAFILIILLTAVIILRR